MNIVITGASKGIGFETALAMAADKNNTVIAISRNKDGLAKLQQQATTEGMHIITHAADLKLLDEAAMQNMFAPYPVIDVLINNAGILLNKSFMETSGDEWRNMFETNVFSQLSLTRFLVPMLSKSNVAHIVNIGSMGGYQGSSKFVGLSAYSASKAALANITECLAEELKPLNIKVNCLALGAVNTEMLAAAFPGFDAPVSGAAMAKFISSFALGSHQFFNGKILPVAVSTP
ncbi:MAG TPA: SDR family NAD(P)-dependent oxidoreductase [Chitinophagaceae bacterium]|nr:SDR family NAD(P)-dependent oxidoreductase [Chitinophagaceae bacterium]